jgi:hypothetical protein
MFGGPGSTGADAPPRSFVREVVRVGETSPTWASRARVLEIAGNKKSIPLSRNFVDFSPRPLYPANGTHRPIAKPEAKK